MWLTDCKFKTDGINIDLTKSNLKQTYLAYKELLDYEELMNLNVDKYARFGKFEIRAWKQDFETRLDQLS